jgi:peptidoglycan/xylan/chitin deacetylase (PgdA/CDA1 family)
MDALLRTAIPVRVDLREPLGNGERYAAVTFDDGFKSVAENAVPELIERSIPATIFVTSDLLGETPGWAGYPGRFMSLEELRELPSGLISLGSHTRTHPFLPKLDEQAASDEIGGSRLKLREMLGRECTLFAFPYGAFTPALVSVCRRAGYQRIFTTLPYTAQLGPDEFVSGRVTVEPTDWQIEFALKLRGAYQWLPAAFATKRKLKNLFSRKTDFGRPLRHQAG